MELERLTAVLPRDFYLTLVDVGSAGGLHARWHPFRATLSAILFDPREATASGSLGAGQTRVYPVALSDIDGEAVLNITALPNMSSFLLPDAQVFGRYRKKGQDAQIVGTEHVPVTRLDILAKTDGFRPDVLKIDTQGSEMMVLKGAEESLKSVVLAEIEASFLKRYVDQPVFADIEAWMNGRGFELIELYGLKRYRAANHLGIYRSFSGHGQRSGRVAYGDAIFMRSEETIQAMAANDGGVSLYRAMVALLAYGKTDHAAALLDRGRHLLPADQFDAVSDVLKAFERPRFIARLSGLMKGFRS
jgi:FkbM family methyltransferase